MIPLWLGRGVTFFTFMFAWMWNRLAVRRNQILFTLAVLASGIFHPTYLCLRTIEDCALFSALIRHQVPWTLQCWLGFCSSALSYCSLLLVGCAFHDPRIDTSHWIPPVHGITFLLLLGIGFLAVCIAQVCRWCLHILALCQFLPHPILLDWVVLLDTCCGGAVHFREELCVPRLSSKTEGDSYSLCAFAPPYPGQSPVSFMGHCNSYFCQVSWKQRPYILNNATQGLE